MALFDKPFRYVPTDSVEVLPDADVAVVDSITPADDTPAPPAAASAAPADRVEVPEAARAESPEADRVETPVADRVEIPEVPAPHAIVPAANTAELVPHAEHALTPAGEPGD